VTAQVSCGAIAGRSFSEKSVQTQLLAVSQYNESDSTADCHSGLVEAPLGERKLALRVEALSKWYDAIKALSGFSFEVRQSEVFGLLGSNGAGKTTLISILATDDR
jgi:ABC-type polysaccharide/polyol phosphate transport system ATPase subunit